jgi:diacylglycerol kinase (ATP)
MAIKGKGKTKPKQAARAPRRAPVAVKPPFFRRRWVQALAAFLAGLLVMAAAWWAWENLDAENNRQDQAAKLVQQQGALNTWGKGNLEPTLTTVGQLQGSGTPQVATSVGTALDALQQHKDPDVSADDLTALADKLGKAANKLDKFKLPPHGPSDRGSERRGPPRHRTGGEHDRAVVAPARLEQLHQHPGARRDPVAGAAGPPGGLITPAAGMVVVANPSAGGGKAGKVIGRVARLLQDAGIDHEIVVSTSGPDLEGRVRAAADDGATAVGCIGGDGTVGLAANALVGSPTALAVFPSGTADDFAHAIGLRHLDTAVRAVADGTMTRIDTGRVSVSDTARHYVAIASCGFDSEVNEAANAMRIRLGSTGTYVAAVVKTLSRFTPAGFTIDVDGEVERGPHMLVAVGNSTSYGGGMQVTPAASVVDGELDVCMLRALGTAAFLRAFPRVFRGTHVTHPAVRMARGKRIHIETDRHVMVYADGERVGPAPATFEVVPASLSIFVGPNAKAVR